LSTNSQWYQQYEANTLKTSCYEYELKLGWVM